MLEESVRTRLENMRIKSAGGIAKVQTRLAEVAAEQDAVHQEIQRLREQLAHLSETERQYQEQLEELQSQEVLRAEAKVVYTALTEGYKVIRQRLEETLTLCQQRTNLLREYPTLKEDVADYRKAEKAKAHLDSLPDSYRQALLKYHQEMAARVEPYLAVRRLEGALQERSLPLPVIMVPLPEESQINWIIPLPSNQDLFPEPIEDFLDDLLEALLNAILRISRHPDWFFAGMDEDPLSWQGYWTLTTLMEYEGEAPMIDGAQQLLSEHLAEQATQPESATLRRLHFEVDLAQLPPEAWLWSQAVSLGEEVASTTAAEAIPLFERSQGWYKDEDVVSWERPLKVSENSNWNAQARRLRTMLVNLIGEGKVGGDTVAAELLWQPLPASHAKAMHQGINALLEHDVLREVANGQLTVNSARMTEVQNLINRDIDEFWQQITGAADATSQNGRQ